MPCRISAVAQGVPRALTHCQVSCIALGFGFKCTGLCAAGITWAAGWCTLGRPGGGAAGAGVLAAPPAPPALASGTGPPIAHEALHIAPRIDGRVGGAGMPQVTCWDLHAGYVVGHQATLHQSAQGSAPGMPCEAGLPPTGLAAPDAAARLDVADSWPPPPPPPPPPQLRAGPLWQHVSSGLPLADAWFSVRASACDHNPASVRASACDPNPASVRASACDPNPAPFPTCPPAAAAPPACAAPGARGAPGPGETGVPAGSVSGGLGATRPPSAHAEDSPLARGRSACAQRRALTPPSTTFRECVPGMSQIRQAAARAPEHASDAGAGMNFLLEP